MRSLK